MIARLVALASAGGVAALCNPVGGGDAMALGRFPPLASRQSGAARTMTLPRYLLQGGQAPTIAEGFENAAQWTRIAGSPTIQNNTTPLQFSQGTRSVKLIATAGSGAVTMRKTGLSLNVSQGTSISFDAVNHYSRPITVTITLWVTPTSKGWQWRGGQTSLGRFNSKGWNKVVLRFADASVVGGAQRSQTVTAIDLTFTSPAVGAAISFDNLCVGLTPVPAICLSFHDTWLSHYTQAYPILSQRGLRGNLVLQAGGGAGSGGVGTGVTRMTYPQVLQIVRAGWTPLNHGTNHALWSSMANQAAVERDLSTARANLIAGGVPSAPVSKYFSYPGGETGYDGKARNALVAQGYVFGHGSGETSTHFPYPDLLHTGSRVLGGATLSALQTELGNLVNRGGCGIYVSHDVAPSGGDITPGNLGAFCDAIIGRRIPVVTWDELYRLQSGPVAVQVPW